MRTHDGGGDKLFRTGRPIEAPSLDDLAAWEQSTTLEDKNDGIEEDAVMAIGVREGLTVDIAAGGGAGRRRQPVCVWRRCSRSETTTPWQHVGGGGRPTYSSSR